MLGSGLQKFQSAYSEVPRMFYRSFKTFQGGAMSNFFGVQGASEVFNELPREFKAFQGVSGRRFQIVSGDLRAVSRGFGS